MTPHSQKLPKRSSRFGVGKDIGGAVYLHRDYEERLGNAIVEAKARLPETFDYHVVKYNYLTGTFSFVQCIDFDSATEPTVGDIMTIDGNGDIRIRRQRCDPEIYHHKWLFVGDDYAAFDLNESRQRSITWMQLDGIDRRRIGRKGYWEKVVISRLNRLGVTNSQEGYKHETQPASSS